MATIKKAWTDLHLDLAAYERGLVPTDADMKGAPRLEQWWAVVEQIGHTYVMRACGEVRGHSDVEDGARIKTSPVRWWDRHDRWVRAVNRLYVLGEGAGDPIPLDGIDR
jgi:hypothetical protein